MRYCKQVSELSRKHELERKQNGGYKEDAAEFLSGLHRDDKLIPIITTTIYWSEKEWQGPRRLHDMMDVKDERLLKFVQDYDINLIEPSGIEDFEVLQSDLREVMEAIKASADKRALEDLLQSREEYRSLDRDAAKMISICANMHLEFPEGEEMVDMCKAIDDMRMESKEEGRQ